MWAAVERQNVRSSDQDGLQARSQHEQWSACVIFTHVYSLLSMIGRPIISVVSDSCVWQRCGKVLLESTASYCSPVDPTGWRSPGPQAGGLEAQRVCEAQAKRAPVHLSLLPAADGLPIESPWLLVIHNIPS